MNKKPLFRQQCQACLKKVQKKLDFPSKVVKISEHSKESTYVIRKIKAPPRGFKSKDLH